MELFGRGYVIDHCISALKQKEREDAFQIYVTDTLMMISKNTAAAAVHCGGEGKYLQVRFWDILHPKPQETRTAEEIKQKFLDYFHGQKEVNDNECI